MAHLTDNPPHGVTAAEWQRAVALTAAAAAHAEKGSGSAIILRGEVLDTAKRFLRFLQDGS